MNRRKTVLSTLFLLCVGITSATATPVTFNFTGANNNANAIADSLTFGAGLRVTVTAYGTSNLTAGGTLTQGAVDEYTYTATGLGVCNSVETSGCSGANQQVDNSSQYDFLLFKFSTPVTLSQVVLNRTGTSTFNNMSYWTSTQASVAIGSIGSQPAGLSSQTTISCGTCTTATDALTATNVTYLLLGAGYATGTTDNFEISSLTVATPEPASVGLRALSLAGLGLAGKWRKRGANLV